MWRKVRITQVIGGPPEKGTRSTKTGKSEANTISSKAQANTQNILLIRMLFMQKDLQK